MINVRFYGSKPYRTAVLHGGPGALGSVAAVARELGKDFGVLEPLQTKNSIAELLTELDEVLTVNCDRPIVLIGHSWGAWLAWLYAARNPKMVGKLILIGSGPFEMEYVDQINQNRLKRLAETERAELLAILERLDLGQADDKHELMSRLSDLVARTDNYCPLELEDERSDRLPVDGELYCAIWEEAAQLRKSGELLGLAKQIACPVVVIHGTIDPHPFEGVKTPLAKRIKDLRIYRLEKCGHHPWKEKYARERFYEILRKELVSD